MADYIFTMRIPENKKVAYLEAWAMGYDDYLQNKSSGEPVLTKIKFAEREVKKVISSLTIKKNKVLEARNNPIVFDPEIT